MTTLRSNAPAASSPAIDLRGTEMYPTLPLYTPRGPGSRVSMISTVRNLGAPVMDPGGNAAATH